jgi:hypothetical protein
MVDGCHRGGRLDTLTTLQSSLEMMDTAATPVCAALPPPVHAESLHACGERTCLGCRVAPSLRLGTHYCSFRPQQSRAFHMHGTAPSPRSKADKGTSNHHHHHHPAPSTKHQAQRPRHSRPRLSGCSSANPLRLPVHGVISSDQPAQGGG